MNVQNSNLYSHFQSVFSNDWEKVALTQVNGDTLTYKDLDQGSARLANSLLALGVSHGDRVSVQVEKSPEALMLYLACLRSGLVFHPLNTGYKANELEYFLGNAEPAVVVTTPNSMSVFEPLCATLGISHLFTLQSDGTGSLMDLAASASSSHSVVNSGPDDMASLLYSSGTTGVPKGIILTHQNLLSNAQSLVSVWGFTADDVLLHALPIFHVHGLFVALGCVFLSGASMRWLKGFDLDQALAGLPQCTAMMGVPTYYIRLLTDDRFTNDVVKDMRLFVSGSAPLLEETFHEFEQRTGHRILERYGMSETNMNTSNPLNGERKPGTVGLPLPGVSVRVVDDNNTALPVGEIGNLQVRGENVFKGYWKLPEKTAEDFTNDGFFNTGDNGRIDEDGYVAIVGRAKDMVITGGLNVYPKEVELIIDELPQVKESAVFGVPHRDFGEAVVAVIVRDGSDANGEFDEQAMIQSIKELLSGFKVPKRIFAIEQLPRNTMGKVQKNMLRQEYATLFSEIA